MQLKLAFMHVVFFPLLAANTSVNLVPGVLSPSLRTTPTLLGNSVLYDGLRGLEIHRQRDRGESPGEVLAASVETSAASVCVV